MAKFLPVYDDEGRLARLISIADIRHVSASKTPGRCDLLLGAVGTTFSSCDHVSYPADIDVVFALVNS